MLKCAGGREREIYLSKLRPSALGVEWEVMTNVVPKPGGFESEWAQLW
jgi:hypothetical protein